MKLKFIGLAATAILTGCATQSAAPDFVPPFDPSVQLTGTDTMAPKAPPIAQSASLWTAEPSGLLGMNRAPGVGDLLTVVVNMNDQANLRNSLTRTRDSSEDLSVEALFGLPQWAQTILPQGSSFSPAIDIDRMSELQGDGAAIRAEQVAFRLAARVAAQEPNGNLIIQGYQQTMVGGETRYLAIMGIIRPQDILNDNTIAYDRIANAQISYVSAGPATGNVEQKFIPKIFDKYLPF